MIECSTSFPPAASFLLRCGSIAADAVVIWEKSGRYGVNFRLPLSEWQVREQLSRNGAICARQAAQAPTRHCTDRSSTATTLHQAGGSVGSSASALHFSAIEASHQQVELCMLALETFMEGELSDIGHFSAARLRLRQANLARTHVALEACRHLMTIQHAPDSLQDLRRSELDVSQMISEHVQRWTVQALQDDWGSYCRTTRKVLEGVRELIAAEKKLLCPMLREGAPSSGY